jgi:hypothetical protein
MLQSLGQQSTKDLDAWRAQNAEDKEKKIPTQKMIPWGKFSKTFYS